MVLQTVAAIATPPGRGGIAVIRISGPQSYQVAKDVFVPTGRGKQVMDAKGYTALYGTFIYRGKEIDEGIALFFRAPASYTGEDVVELSCHGGEVVSGEVLLACIEAGAAPAGPGEFTKRALLNGKMSLLQAEAVMDLISATSRQGAAAATAALNGRLYKEIQEIKQSLVALAGHLAAYVDYPEEDVETLTLGQFTGVLQEQRLLLQGLIDEYNKGAIVRSGVQTVIVGSPNVGKSTLFNLLSGYERAIVTAMAGTTRDVLRESIELEGVTLHLADTAGLHEADDAIEQEGIRRTYAAMETAALVMAVFDASVPLTEAQWEIARHCEGRPALAILNKNDLGSTVQPEQLAPYFTKVVEVSALRQQEARRIVEQGVLQALDLEALDANAPVLANTRQLAAVVAACSALGQAEETLKNGITFDAAGVYLDDALYALAELTGEDASDAVIEEVFSSFCVGK